MIYVNTYDGICHIIDVNQQTLTCGSQLQLYVPWQMEEIIKGKYFMKDADWDIQRITGLKSK